MGDARNWGYILGYDSSPNIGAVAWTPAGAHGHVAVVVAVGSDGVEIKEENGPNGPWTIDYRWVSPSDFYYIHI